jgi:hypothetical protein
MVKRSTSPLKMPSQADPTKNNRDRIQSRLRIDRRCPATNETRNSALGVVQEEEGEPSRTRGRAPIISSSALERTGVVEERRGVAGVVARRDLASRGDNRKGRSECILFYHIVIAVQSTLTSSDGKYDR